MFASTNHSNSSSKKKTCKMEISYKKLTMGLQNYKDIKEAHLKNRACEQSSEFKQNKQCTFQPQLSAKKTSQIPEQRRSLKKFLEDQEKFTSTKRNKIELLRQQISKQQEDQVKGKPSIDSASHRISTQMGLNSNQKVFQRLSKQKKQVIDLFQEEEMFSPKICMKSRSLKRQKDVSNLLYQDAQRRKQKQGMKFEQLLKRQFAPKINSNTNSLIVKKIYSQFTERVHEQNIPPLLAITVISQMFNVDLNPNKSSEQEELCEKVLFYIADTKTQSVNSEVLWNFIQTIVNGHLINSNFTEEEEDKILQSFGYFYGQRLSKRKQSLKGQQHTFKPHTLRSSQKLARNHRQRTLSGINEYLQNQKVHIEITNNSVKIQDLFIIEHMKKNSQNQKKRIEKQNNELKQCSFKPNIQLSTNSIIQSQKNGKKKVSLVAPRSTKAQELQKMFKVKKNQDDIQNKQNERVKTMYENNGISKRLNETTNRTEYDQKTKVQVKNIQKSVMRVALARKNRQLVNVLNERGYPSNVQNWDSFRKSLKKDVQKSSQKFLKGYSALHQSSSSLLKSSILTSNQLIT